MNHKRFAIVYSKQDLAGINIIEEMEKLDNNLINNIKIKDNIIKPVEVDIIYAEDINKNEEIKYAEFIIFASRHSSEKKIKSLSVHAPGNWGRADYGGKPNLICPTSALFLKHIFQILSKNNKDTEYQTTLECTHHGPYISKPCCFIEIGSSKNEWQDKEAGKIIAKTILESISKKPEPQSIPVIGIGGPHYCQSFNKIQLNSKYAISHVIPNYVFPLTKEMIKQAISKTEEKIKTIILDWKGLGNSESRKQVMDILNKFNIKILRTGEVEKS